MILYRDNVSCHLNYQFQERKRKIGKKPQNEKLMQQKFEKREQVLYFGHSGEALLQVSTDLISIGSY